MRILVTRPSPDGERTAQTLRQRGHAPLFAPLMRVEAQPATFGPGPFSAVLFTSANAPRALAQHPRRGELMTLPAFAVGDASASAARESGFAKVESADGDAGDLLRLVVSRLDKKDAPLLYLAGEDRAADLAGALQEHELRAEIAVIYRAVAAPLSPEAVKALSAGTLDGVLHFSRRSAKLYVEGAQAAGIADAALRPKHYCLATQTAELLQKAGAKQVSVAARPQESLLLALIG
jgi:uroporphyrinogen-III synthase